MTDERASPLTPETRHVSFVGGASGSWRVVDTRTIVGEPIAHAARLHVSADRVLRVPDDAQWLLRGVTSYGRYTTRAEKRELTARQPPIGRVEATCAALIPVRKNAAWWALSQDERRAIFEESSRHIAIGMRFLPAIARRLHHSRDIWDDEPFDFLTWFEFAPSELGAFDALLAELRATQEWTYVDREIELRVVRVGG